MTKLISVFILSTMIGLVLASCSFSSATETPVILPTASLADLVKVELTVQADTTVPFNAVGQVIKYNYTVKNTGSASAPGPVVVVGATCPEVNTVGNLDAVLDVNESLVCTSAYTITQADLDKGSVSNVATAAVSGVSSAPITTTVATVQSSPLKLTKTANPVTYDKVGQIITYTYVITNTGPATLGPAQFTVSDAGFTAPINCGDATLSLASTLTVTCSAVYTITQANLDVGTVATNATASGGGAPASQPASATIAKGAAAVPSVVSPANLTAGSTVQHKVVTGEWLWQIARCYGVDPTKVLQANTQLSNPAQISPNMIISVPNIGSAGKIYGPPCVGTHTVLTGDTWSSIALKYNADPTILQMVNANTLTVGKVLNVPLNSFGAAIPVPASSALKLTITANPTAYSQVGQVITYTYVITNTGATTLGPTQFTVSSALIGATPINCGAASSSLATNATVTCTATYTVTQANLDAGSIISTATASGGGAATSLAASSTVNKGTLALTLTTTANPITYNQVGQVITYTYVITNSGTIALGPTQFIVTDSLVGAVNCGAATTSLAPSLTVTCTATYTATQANLDAGPITSTSTASGGGAAPSQPVSVTINKQ